MKYLFENEIALEVYCKITKELCIEIVPKISDDMFYVSEESMMDSLKEITAIQHRQK